MKHFYSLVWSYKLNLKILWRLDQWLLRYTIFSIWGLLPSFIGGCLHLKYLYSLVCHISLSFEFCEDRTSGSWDIPFLIFKVFFHYFTGGRLYLKHFYSLVWSHKLKFKIWGRSDQWLLRYLSFKLRIYTVLLLIIIIIIMMKLGNPVVDIAASSRAW